MEDKAMDQTLNIGTEVTLAAGLTKHIKIGSIGLIRQVRQLMKGKEYNFSFCIGRDKWPATEDRPEVNWPEVETTYKEAFNLVLVEGLSDEEYERVDENGIKELDGLLNRFL
ncbi:hypothetical protein P4H66_19435 [Paenibacillus dokdonensis]|uniref:Uncharacterized protein n=1 Tax=Paenibacillus dokdonensis TaxID=2567944 RepID=A0ABU6GRJ5_9BACL|nr:hypothetical protein [Paenibacillus dokdonensis]MEC0241979.1 hypothetical protein [Paenibacillus dokdonensis]